MGSKPIEFAERAARRLLDELEAAQRRLAAAREAGRPDEEAAAEKKVADLIRRIRAIQDR